MIDSDKGTVIVAVSEGIGYLLLTALKGLRSKQGQALKSEAKGNTPCQVMQQWLEAYGWVGSAQSKSVAQSL